MTNIMQTKGVVKVCPTCGNPMSLMKLKIPLPHSFYYWFCTCGYMVNYSSFEASELKDVEVE